MNTALRILPVFFLASAMFYFPQEVVTAAAGGLALWWQFVLPALLPFFIISELLMAAGFVHFLGVLLEPLMRPLFRLPGKASFIIAMSYTSGIPIGAVLTTKLRKQGDLTREEGERLLAFTCNPSPGFMFGAVASGMLGNPVLGFVLAASVYLANLTVGLIFRFYRSNRDSDNVPTSVSFKRAWHEMAQAQTKDGRPFGQMLGDSIRQSTTTILMVGGFITFFSVIIKMLTVWHITNLLARTLNPILGSFMSMNGIEALINGLVETTIGCQRAIQAYGELSQQVGIVAFFLGWGGISVFAQVASFTSTTDLRFSAFVIGRTLHAVLALIISKLLLVFYGIPAAPILLRIPATTSELWWNTWRLSTKGFILAILGLIILAALSPIFRRKQRY